MSALIGLGKSSLLVALTVGLVLFDVRLPSAVAGSKWKAISEKRATLVFYGPGLEMARKRFERRKEGWDIVFERGQWQAVDAQWPEAQFRLMHYYQHTGLRYVFTRRSYDLLRTAIHKAFADEDVAMEEQGESSNHIGPLEYQRFSVRGGIHCVFMRQYYGDVSDVFLLKTDRQALGHTRLQGWYCAKSIFRLSDETLSKVFAAIGVKGTARPRPPANVSEAKVAQAPPDKRWRPLDVPSGAGGKEMVTCVLQQKSLPATKRGRGLTRPETTLMTTRAACLEEGGTISE